MYFDRKGIKAAAKVALKRSHWTVVVVVLLVSLLGGTIAGGTSGSSASLNTDQLSGGRDTDTDVQVPGYDADDIWTPDDDMDGWADNPWTDDEWTEDLGEEDNYTLAEIWEDFVAEWNAVFEEFGNEIGLDFIGGWPVLLGAIATIAIFAILIALALNIFVGNVMTVGGHGWLMRYWRGETPSIGEAFASFRIYKPSVVTMLVKNIYIFFWSLLFIIPGIIKTYAYSMVPYIIYENPNLTPNEAITISRKMTDGYKADLFVFDLSFIGWNLLSAITGGLVGVLYVNPFMGVAHAGVYEDLKWKAIQNGRLTWEDFGQTPPSDPWMNPPMPYPPYDGGQPNGAPANAYGAAAPSYTPPANPFTPPVYTPPTYTSPTDPPNQPWDDPNQPQG